MRFIDEAKILVKAGDGGKGCLSFRREKYVPLGGPDGGDGGDGGSIIIQASDSLNTLADFKNKSKFIADNGGAGSGSNKKGKTGEDLIIIVPTGSMIFDTKTEKLVCDLEKNEQSIKIVDGGKHGFGNSHFKSSTNRAPRKTTNGKNGEEKELKIILKVLADVGLIGLPNVGKSSLLGSISMAKPKIANYEFTTIHPNLGVVLINDYEKFVVADIPGLIKGASKGAGLGIQFLKHISRTKLLLHVIDASCNDLETIIQNINIITKELNDYDLELSKKDRWFIFNKIDQLDNIALKHLKDYVDGKVSGKIFFVSAKNKFGLKNLCEDIFEYIKNETKY